MVFRSRFLISPVALICPLLIFASGKAMADHLSGGFELGQSSAILTESAVTLPTGSWYGSISTEAVDNKLFSDDRLIGLRALDIVGHGVARADLHSVEDISSTTLTIGYGFTDNFTIGLRIPYVKRTNIREPEEGHGHDGDPIVIHDVIEHGDSSGWGDATLMGQYRFYNDGAANMAMLFGLQIPTGDEDATGFVNEVFVRRVDTGVVTGQGAESGHQHEGNLLETHQQPGASAYNPVFGLAYSRQLNSFNLDSSVLYTFANQGAQATDLGDNLKYNLALAYPLEMGLDLVLEVNGEWQDREVRGSEVINNSGGSLTYVSPGLRYRGSEGWSVSLSYGLPVIEDLHGFQSEPDHRWIGSLAFNF